MDTIPDSTADLLLSSVMGMLGGLLTIPISALFSWLLKRDEQLYQHRLDVVAKQQELLLQHQLEMDRKGEDEELAEIRVAITRVEKMLGINNE